MRRFILPILVYLVIGAVVNVGVAWWLAARPEVPAPQSMFQPQAKPIVWSRVYGESFRHEAGAYIRRGELRVTEYYEANPWPGFSFSFIPEDTPAERMFQLLPSMSLHHNGDPLDALRKQYPERDLKSMEHYTGWPLLCFAMRRLEVAEIGFGSYPRSPTFRTLDSAGIMQVKQEWLPQGWRQEIPTRIVWPGLVTNTVFFATCCWLLTFGPVRLHRRTRAWRRSRAGLCLDCGYDRRGLAADSRCPECGAAPAKGPS